MLLITCGLSQIDYENSATVLLSHPNASKAKYEPVLTLIG